MISKMMTPAGVASAGERSASRRTEEAGAGFVSPAATNWLRLALQPATLRRALLTAVLVGWVLIAINHGDAILRGDLTIGRIAKMLLTVAVPYLVSTVSSVAALRDLGRRRGGKE